MNKLRVLGLWIQQTAGVAHTLHLLKGTTQNVAKMIRRVTRTRDGFSEEETIRLVHAFVISRITYALPFQSITKQELKQLEVIIRRAFKAALGLPENTSTERFEKLGIHNTFEEYATATLIAQRERLCASTQGRAILTKLGFALRPQFSAEETVQMTQEVRQHIMVSPIPKNMSPKYHAGRRKARARNLHKRFRGQSDVYYTDASQTGRDKYTVVATNQNRVIAASVRAKSASTAEAAAIALAIRDAENRDVSAAILTDSQTACRLYLSGTAPRLVLKILGVKLPDSTTSLGAPHTRAWRATQGRTG